jgi:hypothetical protein
MAVLSSPLSLLLAVPPVTRAFTAATVILSSIYAWLWWSGLAQEGAPYITLVPGSALFHPWTLVISALVETSLMEVRSHYIFLMSTWLIMSAHCNSNFCTRISKILGTPVGKRGTCEIHPRISGRVKYHRFRVQLDRIFCIGQSRALFVCGHTLGHTPSFVTCTLARYGMQYHGQMSLQIALLVAFTQLIPEHQVQVMGVLRARVKVRDSCAIIYR